MTTSYERPPVIWREDDVFEFRASQIMSCDRQLFYSADSEPKTDDLPRESRARMRMGQVLEGYVLEAMVDHGWDIPPADAPEMGTLELNDQYAVTGILDAIGSHPEHCPEPGVIEVKTRNSQAFRMIKNMGNLESQRGAVVQLAVYRKMAVASGKVSEEANGMIASLNKDTSEVHVEYFSPTNLDAVLEDVVKRLDRMMEQWTTGEPPAVTLPKDHWRCQSCEWRTHCGNVSDIENTAPVEVTGGNIDFQEVLDAFLIWEEQRAIELESQPDEKLMKWARGILKAYAQERGFEKFDIAGKHGEYSVSLQDRTTVAVNKEKARFYLTEAQWKEVAEVKSSDPFVTIRESKRKK